MVDHIHHNILTLASCYHLLLQQFSPVDEKIFLERCQHIKSKKPDDFLKQLAKFDHIKIQCQSKKLNKINAKELPLIAENKDGEWLIIFFFDQSGFLIKKFNESPQHSSLASLQPQLSGKIIKFHSLDNVIKHAYFDFSWFIPQIKRFKGFFPELIASSIALQLMALFIPISFQVIMDKVINNQAQSTLTVMLWVLVFVAIMEAVLFCSRQYLAIHTANRIDASLSNKLITHLFKLPFTYFLSRNIGVTVMRVTQLHTIRAFLASAANTLVLDCTFLMVFFAVMLIYSPLMTLIVFSAIPLCLLVSIRLTPQLQQKLLALYHFSAQNTAFLTESLNSIETLKSQASEPRMQQRFETQTRDMTLANFKVSRIIQLQSMMLSLIQKITLAAVIIIGARKVIDGEMSIGQLIAFNMMAQYAFQPILKLAELWRDFIQTKVSMIQLGDVINRPIEIEAEKTPFQCNRFVLEDIRFSFDLKQKPVIDQVSLTIEAGQKIAIVGESGCGKSTLIRLLQNLFRVQEGNILINDTPIEQINPQYLRQKIALITQENFLFNRSVRDNIALNNPKVQIDEVVNAAKIAQAHDFIVALAQGYDTQIDEAGSSLSGGQRQRIAIARALLQGADTLILDEATSALDESTQNNIINTLSSRNETIIMVAHRLSTIKHCDCIYVMHQGRVIESGTHHSLINSAESHYYALWQCQRQQEE